MGPDPTPTETQPARPGAGRATPDPGPPSRRAGAPRAGGAPSGQGLALGLAALALQLAAGCGRLSGGGGNSVEPDGPVVPPPTGVTIAPVPGLVGAAGAPAAAVVEWFAEIGVNVAVFASTDPNTVFAGLPLLEAPPGNQALISPLTDDTIWYLGLGLEDPAAPDAGTYLPTEVILTVRTGAPLYVDAAAPAEGADGLTPGTAFPTLLPALLTSFVQGGRNVWVAGGEYSAISLPVFAGTHVFGGFDPATFDPATRDPDSFTTKLNGAGNQPAMQVQGSVSTVVLDGLQVDGQHLVFGALEVVDTPVELRDMWVHSCTSTGVKLRALETGDAVPTKLIACAFTGNGGEGLDGRGALRFQALGCVFASNGQEGLGFTALVAPDGRTAGARLVSCQFQGNGTDGADIDLAAPLFGGLNGGFFDVSVEDCAFELNGTVGLLLDVDYELHPLWDARVVVRGSTSRGNLGDGIHLDLDGRSSNLLQRVLASGNGAHGLRLTSETFPSVVTVSASAFVGNTGTGLLSEIGNGSLLASHCIVAGNAQAGVNGVDTAPVVTSSATYLQPAPWDGAQLRYSVDLPDTLGPSFVRVPVAYGRIVGSGETTVTLSAFDAGMSGGTVVELAEDGVLRTVVSVNGLLLTLDTLPEVLLVPSMITRFDPVASVLEDYHAAPGSSAEGAGMASPGGPAVDAGVYGSPLEGEPGTPDDPSPPLFHASVFTPPLTSTLAALDSLRIAFSPSAPDPATVSAATVTAELADGTPLLLPALVDLGELVVGPPLGGWPAGVSFVKLHAGLASLDGTPLTAPLALPVTSP